MQTTNFIQTQAVLHALEFTLDKGGFSGNPKEKKAALALMQRMKSNRSLSGRQQQLLNLLKKGATIEQIMSATHSSRRTVFRYLNHFEDAGMKIELINSMYKLKS